MTTASILQSARNFAHEVLHPVSKEQELSQGDRDVHHHHYHGGYGYWGYDTRPIFISNGCPSTSKKKDKEFLAAIMVATVVILVASYCIGAELGRRSDISVHKQILEDQEQMLEAAQEPGKERTFKVLEIEKRMLDMKATQSLTGLMTKTALLGSAIAALTGALVGSPVGLGVATACGAVSLGSTLIHWGYANADTTVQEEAVRLLCAVDRAEAP